MSGRADRLTAPAEQEEELFTMRHIRLLGLALTAIFALGVVGASSAIAENPEILPVPTPTTPLAFTIDPVATSKPTLETSAGAKIVCNEAKGSGEFTSARLGTGTINLTGECNFGGTKCKAEGDTNGTLLMKVDVHLVDVLPLANELRLGIVLQPLPQPFVLTCGLGKIELLGSAIGVVLVKDLQKTKDGEVHFEGTKGMQSLTECDLDKAFCETGGMKNKILLESEAGKGRELAAWLMLVIILTAKEVEIHF
jgi:hypothetical protein